MQIKMKAKRRPPANAGFSNPISTPSADGRCIRSYAARSRGSEH
jgi:hypothetical protein